jgi:rubrerythrin
VKLDEAIKTALEFEGKVHKTYLDAMQAAESDVAKRAFRTLCDEEKGHIEYLRERLDEWKQTGKITVVELATVIPSRETIEAGVQRLKEKVAGQPGPGHDVELESLRRALEVEVETANFYKEMVRTLDADGQRLFRRFVEIEEGHQAIVQAEIDCLTGSGFWFDSFEVHLESG